eukprot:TRINITY_DN15134_c0_g2_i1.p1 TRINITY_DN15134_c0_g2~~TRINITY_DN15134_c0_g2_i1.p1  ORF type:complete len:723 (-),score=137.69 TRINITY_DN15134_c0_g2_i1:124-2292(-)
MEGISTTTSTTISVISETIPSISLTPINNTPNNLTANNNNAIVALNNSTNSGSFRTDSFGDQELEDDEIEVQEIIDQEGSKWDDWRWHKNGQSVLKDNGRIRQHYCCQKRKFGCTAKLVIDTVDGGQQVHPPIGKHNHSPPEKPREKTQYLQPPRITPKNQALGEKIHTEITEAPSFKMAPLHTKSPRVMKPKGETSPNGHDFSVKKSKVPSSDALQNILSQHRKTFLMKLTLFPDYKVILASQTGLDILAEYGNEVCIGGTFSVCEGALFLSTLLVWYKEMAFPVCWFISDSKTSETYHKFLQYMVKKTKGTWNPSIVFVDFEDPWRDAIQKTFFGRTTITNSYFHFVQSHIGWMNANNGSHLIKDLNSALYTVWSSPDAGEFEKRKTDYLQKMQTLHPQYVKYFNSIWVQLFKPVNWAYFGRVNAQFASIGHALEGWYNRLKANVIEHSTDSVDLLVNALWGEWAYYELLWNEHGDKERTLNKSSRSANDIHEPNSPTVTPKRFRSDGGINNNNNSIQNLTPILPHTPLSNISQIITTPSADLNLSAIPSILTPQSIPSIEFMEHDFYHNSLSDSGNNSNVTSPSSSSNSLTAPLFKSKSTKNCACGKASNGCGKCISCCGNDESNCTIINHMAKKNEKFQASLLDKLHQMITSYMANNNTPDTLWIRYIHDHTPTEIFEVKPTKWKNRHTSFYGICQRDGMEKKFFVHRVKEFSDQALH